MQTQSAMQSWGSSQFDSRTSVLYNHSEMDHLQILSPSCFVPSMQPHTLPVRRVAECRVSSIDSRILGSPPDLFSFVSRNLHFIPASQRTLRIRSRFPSYELRISPSGCSSLFSLSRGRGDTPRQAPLRSGVGRAGGKKICELCTRVPLWPRNLPVPASFFLRMALHHCPPLALPGSI